MFDPLQGLARQYWYDSQWLAIPEGIRRPTCYHLLHIDSGVEDVDVISKCRLDFQERLQSLSKRDAAQQRIASDLINALTRARNLLRDTEKRNAYLRELREEFSREVALILGNRDVRQRSDLNAADIQHLEVTLGAQYGLCATHVAQVIDQLLTERRRTGGGEDWPPGPRFPDDPSYPNYFDLLGLSQSLKESEFVTQIEAHYKPLAEGLEVQKLRTAQQKLKSIFAERLQELEKARATLVDPVKRREYLGRIHGQRRSALETEINRRKFPGETQISRPVYVALLEFGHRVRLSDQDVDDILKQRGLTIPVSEIQLSGQIGPLPIVDLREMPPSGLMIFTFDLSNVGGRQVQAILTPRSTALTLKSSTIDIPAHGQATVTATLNRAKLKAGRQSVQIDVQGPGGGEVWIYATVDSAGPKLQVLSEGELGSLPVGRVSQRPLKLANSGVDDLHCDVESDTPWLTFSNDRITIAGGHADAVIMNLDLREQTEGPYSGLVRIQSNGGNSSLPVSLTAVQPAPGSLILVTESLETRQVWVGEEQEVEIHLLNGGDSEVQVSVSIIPESDVVKVSPKRFTLAPREKRTVELTLSIAEGSQRQGAATHQIVFETDVEPASQSLTLNYSVTVKPQAMGRYAAAMVCVLPMVLVPALLGQIFQQVQGVSTLASVTAWSATPLGLLAFRRLWSTDVPRPQAAFQGVGVLAFLWLIQPVLTYIAGGIIFWCVSLFLGVNAIALGVTVALIGMWLGTMWLQCLTQAGFYKADDQSRLVPWFAVGFGIALIPLLTFHWMTTAGQELVSRPAGTSGEFICLLIVASVTALTSAWRESPVPARLGRTQLSLLCVGAVPLLIWLVALGLGLQSQLTGEATLMTWNYWKSVAWFQFVRLH